MPFGVLFVLLLLIGFYAIKIFFFLNTPIAKQKIDLHLFQGEKIQSPIIAEASPGANFKFNLDTVEGRPFTATLSAKIFVIPPTSTSFSYRQAILSMATTLGFDVENTKYKLEDKNAVFEEPKQTLSVDISNYNFQYQYKLEDDPSIFQNTHVPAETEIIQNAEDFLKKVDKYPADFAKSKPNIIYYTYPITTGANLSNSPQQSTNMVEVDFYRPDIDSDPQPISTVTSKFPNSQNYVAMVFNESGQKVVKAQVKYFEKSEDQVGVYPLKSGDDAYQQLKDGKGYVVNGVPNQTDVTIKKMFLAYYDPEVYQQYLEPVYVFLGTNNFVAYIPAVKDSLLIQ